MIDIPAVLDHCPRCGGQILVAVSDGLPTRADATPLTPQAELAALLDDRLTYDVQPLGLPRRPYLHHRNSWRIQAPRKWPVVGSHRCPPGPHFPRPQTKPVDLIIPIGHPIPDQPPF
ncbi:hypothetical protein OG884_26605 [Streptosporangium sp. NBC_01755]|uniref:hypothetical protein n=1 Tax=Streptosporangium sp. NBC_01755 TaxID=2975949 RepID=UPI002DD94731|nr:hypothetical protein [Streptosporangium sp. NBC_01755]WSC98421.1 hypothetical protein OG884_26605 [Streptosporangium sp. NBC_01755]